MDSVDFAFCEVRRVNSSDVLMMSQQGHARKSRMLLKVERSSVFCLCCTRTSFFDTWFLAALVIRGTSTLPLSPVIPE